MKTRPQLQRLIKAALPAMKIEKPSNIPLQPTVNQLRCLPSAELARWAPQE